MLGYEFLKIRETSIFIYRMGTDYAELGSQNFGHQRIGALFFSDVGPKSCGWARTDIAARFFFFA